MNIADGLIDLENLKPGSEITVERGSYESNNELYVRYRTNIAAIKFERSRHNS